MLKPILAAMVALPFLVAPALAVTMMPTVKPPVQACTGEDCPTVHLVPFRRV